MPFIYKRLYVYKIVVNSQNYQGSASGVMVVAEKKVYPGTDGTQIEDTQGDFSKNNVVIELKSCSREQTDSSHAFRQIKN